MFGHLKELQSNSILYITKQLRSSEEYYNWYGLNSLLQILVWIFHFGWSIFESITKNTYIIIIILDCMFVFLQESYSYSLSCIKNIFIFLSTLFSIFTFTVCTTGDLSLHIFEPSIGTSDIYYATILL